jgi:hypothetical protein
VKAVREKWVEGQRALDPEHLIFIDESGLSTKMARLRGWATKGQRCRAAIPHGHWKTVTFVGGLTRTGFVAPMLLDGPMDGECFLAWVEQMLTPTLRPGDIVIMDNLAALQSRPQPDRKCLRQAQGARAQVSCTHPRRTRTSLRQRPASVQTQPMRKLLRSRRIQIGIRGICSSSLLKNLEI